MPELSGFPYCEVRFGKDGTPLDDAEAEAVIKAIGDERISDLVVVSHGWNNDMDEARDHYRAFASRLRGEVDRPGNASAGKQLGILGVLWPSKKFAERDLIPGGAASVGADGRARLIEELSDLKGVFADPAADAALDRAKALVPDLESLPVQAQFADLLRSVVTGDEDAEDATGEFFRIPGEEVFARLDAPVPFGPPPGQAAGGPAGAVGGAAAMPMGGTGAVGGAAAMPMGGAGAASGLGELTGGVFAAGRRLLNFLTYYQMKERAGTIGKSGLARVLRRIREARPGVKLHFVGHSFGARLVTAAAAASAESARPNSLLLLQAAFSHNGFAQNYKDNRDGAFRAVVADRLVSGPILISHTSNDKAVGLAYAIASRIARENASAIGGPDDLYGGLGRNGARHTPEATDGVLQPTHAAYDFEAGKVYNLRADTVIMDHGDVHKAEVAHALVQAITS